MLGRWGRAACSGWSDGAKAEYPVTPGGNPIHHARGEFVPRPTPRHRRKAGSGPPAAALIAWIGTDRGEPDLQPSSNSRSAINIVASVVLACGAVVAVTVSTAAEVLGPRDATTIPQDHPVPATQVGPNAVLPPVPAAAQPAVVRQAPQSIPVPPATEDVAEATQPPAAPQAPAAAPPPVTERQAAVPRVRSRPDAPAQRRNADAPRTSQSTRESGSSQRPPSDRDSARGERSRLGSTLKRTTDSVESGLGAR
jgi:type IV secretory pathway VirB10-like protein